MAAPNTETGAPRYKKLPIPTRELSTHWHSYYSQKLQEALNLLVTEERY
jgi:hypothetical protein